MSCDAAILMSAYEQLRQQALGSTSRSGLHGLAIVMHQGVASWIQAWATIVPDAAPSVKPRISAVAPDVSNEVISALATMALKTVLEVQVS